MVADSFGDYVIATPYDGAVRVAANSTGTFYGVPITAGRVYTIAGHDSVSYSGDMGPAAAATLNLSFGVGVDSSGNIVICDTANNVSVSSPRAPAPSTGRR